MEWKIGEIFEYNGEWYQCIVGNSCVDCSFNKRKCSTVVDNGDPIGDCCADRRKDNKSVIFKKLEKVGEPITVNGKNVQLLKTTIANCDNCAFYKDVNCDFTCYPRKCYGGEEGTYVEIKTKEDMEENKLNLKPFSLEAAKAGKPVCTRGGRKARIICFDAKCAYRPIVTLVSRNDEEILLMYYRNGKLNDDKDSYADLMMLPEKKEGWVNVYRDCDGANITKDDNIYSSKEAAMASAQIIDGNSYVATTKINWEE